MYVKYHDLKMAFNSFGSWSFSEILREREISNRGSSDAESHFPKLTPSVLGTIE